MIRRVVRVDRHRELRVGLEQVRTHLVLDLDQALIERFRIITNTLCNQLRCCRSCDEWPESTWDQLDWPIRPLSVKWPSNSRSQ